MYLNCRIKIPDTGGKITIKFVSGTSYVYLEQGRIYDKEKKYQAIDEQSDTACQDVEDRMLDMILSAVPDTIQQCSSVVVDCHSRTDVRTRNLKYVSVLILELSHTTIAVLLQYLYGFGWKAALIHKSIAICFTSNMILDGRIVFMLPDKTIYKRFITAILSN